MSIRGIRRVFRLTGTVKDDVDEELAFHLVMREAQLRATGLSAADARALARERFGDAALIRAQCVRSELHQVERKRRMRTLQDLRADIAFAWRGARQAPIFTLSAVLTLALGIAGTTTAFNVVGHVLMQPLPYPQPDRIVRVFGAVNNWDAPFSSPNLRDLERDTHQFRALGGSVWNEATVLGVGDPLRVMTAAVHGDFFGALGVAPALGRILRPEETVIGAPRAAVVSNRFWRDHLGADPHLEHLHFTLRGATYSVVGVMPAGFSYPNDAQIWIGSFYADADTQRATYLWSGIGRLAPGVTVAQAAAEVDGLLKGIKAEYGKDAGVQGGRVRLLDEVLLGSSRSPLLLLFGAVGFVLLVACVNLAGATLARAEARRQEFNIRTALGASRGRLVRQLLTENMLVALLGGAVGCVFAVLLTRLLVTLGSKVSGIPRLSEVAVDLRALVFATAIALLSGILIGILPAWRAARGNLRDQLARGGRSTTDGGRTQRTLVAAEVALAFTLMVGAALLVRSLQTLFANPPGFDPTDITTASVSLPENRYRDSARVVSFFDQTLPALRAIPGVQDVGMINTLPFSGDQIGGGIVTEDAPNTTDRGAYYRLVDDGYFRTLHIAVHRGRVFQPGDRAGATPVAVVTEAFANQSWPGKDPIGRRVKWVPKFDSHDEWLTVIGVVANTKDFAADDGSGGAVYVDYAQRPERALEGVTIVVKAATPFASLLGAAQSRVHAIDADVPLKFSTLSHVMASSVASRRFTMYVMIAFGVFGLFLAALGVYGVLSYSVARRHREIGVRMALGAKAGQVLGLILRDGMETVAIGILMGVAAAAVCTRAMRAMLYGVSPADTTSFIAGAMVLIAVALIACYVPARRAARVDPMSAIRMD